VDLAHNMGLYVVAEGVETQTVLQRLQSIGCDEVQGYFLSRPLSAADFAAWMEQNRETTPGAALRVS